MGADFLRRCAPTFHKALDRRAVELRTPTLFTTDIACVARTAAAEICQDVQLRAGEKIFLRSLGEKLVAQRDNAVVAELPNPPAEYLNFVQAGGGIAGAEVKVVHPLSGTAEIAICE